MNKILEEDFNIRIKKQKTKMKLQDKIIQEVKGSITQRRKSQEMDEVIEKL